MHDLIPLGTTLPGELTTAEIDSAMRFAEAEKSAATREAYASDWKDFSIWCFARAATPLPAHVGIVAAYLSGLADSGRKASTIGRRAAAIGYHHKMAGHEPPTGSEAVKAVLRGIRRTIGSAKLGKAPATADLIGQMIALCPDSMIGKRDRALLCLGFAGAFRRSELCALEVADLTEVPDGLRILIRRSKGDQEGQGQEVAIPRGYKLRPVEAVQTWLAAAEISAGPVFRAVTRGGRVSCKVLADDSAARVVKRYAHRVGLDPASYGGHSLRSGFLTSAAESGASIWKLSEVSRHRSLDTLRGYVRRVDLFKEHAGAAFLALALTFVVLAAPALAQSPQIYAPDGTYLGNLNTNRFDPNSVSNPYGQYGSPYSADSINNPYGQYGSPYSPNSARNPFGTGSGGHR